MQSWAPENLYNLWQRTHIDGPLRRDTDFSKTTKTLFQQRWLAKRLTRGYHGDHIGQTNFERWYLPSSLPSINAAASNSASGAAAGSSRRPTGINQFVEGRMRAGGRTDALRDEKRKEVAARAPVGTMMFREVERRIDVLVFRALFATSVWQARAFVVQGHVKLNGKLVSRLFPR